MYCVQIAACVCVPCGDKGVCMMAERNEVSRKVWSGVKPYFMIPPLSFSISQTQQGVCPQVHIIRKRLKPAEVYSLCKPSWSIGDERKAQNMLFGPFLWWYPPPPPCLHLACVVCLLDVNICAYRTWSNHLWLVLLSEWENLMNRGILGSIDTAFKFKTSLRSMQMHSPICLHISIYKFCHKWATPIPYWYESACQCSSCFWVVRTCSPRIARCLFIVSIFCCVSLRQKPYRLQVSLFSAPCVVPC